MTAEQNGDPSLHSAMNRGNDGGRAVEMLQAGANNAGLGRNIDRPKVDENDNNRVGKCESRTRRTGRDRRTARNDKPTGLRYIHTLWYT